jgi:hypothetical protein
MPCRKELLISLQHINNLFFVPCILLILILTLVILKNKLIWLFVIQFHMYTGPFYWSVTNKEKVRKNLKRRIYNFIA